MADFEHLSLSSTSSSYIDNTWLKRECATFLATSPQTAASFSHLDLTITLFELLSSSRDSNSLQSDLADLLGPHSFDFIALLLLRRADFIAALAPFLADAEAETASDLADLGHVAGKRSSPQYGPQVVITTEKEKRLAKQLRKEEKRAGKRAGATLIGGSGAKVSAVKRALGFGDEDEVKMRREEMEAAKREALFKRVGDVEEEKYPNVRREKKRRKGKGKGKKEGKYVIIYIVYFFIVYVYCVCLWGYMV